MEDEEKMVKKMTLVGLWCIQTNPPDLPPMRKVVEMLEGSLEALVVPPKPLLTPAIMAWETVEESEESEETSSLLYSKIKCNYLTKREETLIASKDAV
ncbi:unnamed protein product [Thlaspi arvense]|uniref:Uncharacterized protein n=1 Tax=Thlaspi arvense TaxID=13288 RepID=A0AAU9T365_THLAR|nr:unnamed protein product [Thlaspi arvense]